MALGSTQPGEHAKGRGPSPFFPSRVPEISSFALRNPAPATQAKIVEQDELTLRRDTISSAVTKREL